MYVILKNAVKPSYRDTICITNLLNYPGIQFKPVWLGGFYWAPVNIGQTVLESSTQTPESTGYVFQWGRNTPFTLLPNLTDDQKIAGPLAYNIANNSANINKFIMNPIAPYDWLKDTPEVVASRNKLWGNGKDEDNPCPSGWRIPTRVELEKLVAAYLVNKTIERDKCRFVFPGDDGQYLYFPYAGWLNFNIGNTSLYARILSWSCEIDPSETLAYYLNIYESGHYEGIHTHQYGYGFGVRCVRK